MQTNKFVGRDKNRPYVDQLGYHSFGGVDLTPGAGMLPPPPPSPPPSPVFSSPPSGSSNPSPVQHNRNRYQRSGTIFINPVLVPVATDIVADTTTTSKQPAVKHDKRLWIGIGILALLAIIALKR